MVAHPIPVVMEPTRVVGAGASAGGLEAFSRLFAALPERSGLAYLLVPHLSPTHPSELTQLMARVKSLVRLKSLTAIPRVLRNSCRRPAAATTSAAKLEEPRAFARSSQTGPR